MSTTRSGRPSSPAECRRHVLGSERWAEPKDPYHGIVVILSQGKGRLTRAQQGDRGIRLTKDWMREYGSWFDSLGPVKAWRQVRSDNFPLYETLVGTRLSYVSQHLTRCEPRLSDGLRQGGAPSLSTSCDLTPMPRFDCLGFRPSGLCLTAETGASSRSAARPTEADNRNR